MDARRSDVLAEVARERIRQIQKYGHNEDIEDGTGPDTCWLLPYTKERASEIEQTLRDDYEDYESEVGKPTWVHLVREELSEAFQENDQEKLEAELIQVAALCVSWVEKIRGRMQWGVKAGDHIVVDNSWKCPADVMAGTHGGYGHGPYTIVYRYPGKAWVELT